jgi:hypothetical protein
MVIMWVLFKSSNKPRPQLNTAAFKISRVEK